MGMKLHEIGGGALAEMFDRAYKKVLMNMKDPNTSFKESRKIVITLSFREDEMRNNADMTIKVDTKLAAAIPFQSKIAFGTGRNGEVVSEEYGAPEHYREAEEKPVEETTGAIKKFRKEA